MTELKDLEGKKILVIEPHPDDACLSLFYFMEKIKAKYHLASIASDIDRTSRFFCKEIGIKWYPTELMKDIHYQKERISPYEIKKFTDSFDHQRYYYLEHHEEYYLEVEKMVANIISKVDCEIVITSLGILHPVHVLVSVACEILANEMNKELIFFAEFPYCLRKFGEKIIDDSGFEPFKISDKSLGKEKVRLLEKHFPSEANILRWDRNNIIEAPEIVFFAGQDKILSTEKQIPQDRKPNSGTQKMNSGDRKIKVSVLSCGGEYMTGAHKHAINTIEALQRIDVDAKLVDFDSIDDPDILFFDSIGISLENKAYAKVNEKRLGKISEYMGKIPFVLVRHSVSERSVFKNSFIFFEDFVWDLIVSTGNTEDKLSLIKEENKFKELVHIDYPFEFDDKCFENKSKYKDVISSPSRLASCKRNHLTLDIAKILHKKKKILMAGHEGGVYWYRILKDHPNRKYVEFIGGYEDYTFPYQKSAFGIDLTYLRRYGRIQKNKQYVFIEAIACGNIPIIFDFWKYDKGFEAVWLPAPKIEGRKTVFDVKEYAEIIGSFKYDFDMAVENRKILKKEISMEKIGNQYKDEFKKLLGI